MTIVTIQCGRSVFQVQIVRVDIRMVIGEAMTPQCGEITVGRLVVKVLVVRVVIAEVTY